MTDFLIRSTFCLFVLLGAYHLFLEREKMHHFNRFYLLFSLIFSLTIPFITIEIIQEIPKSNIEIDSIEAGTFVVEEVTNYLPTLLWSLYGLVTFLFTVKFIKNIIKFISKIKSNATINYKNAKLILLKEKTLPHTFLNTIFINENDYQNRNIEEELYTHELTHVTQKHTLDILFIEILKTIFWFNPIFHFYKKAIQLNHEFLADEKVIKSYNNVPFYQNLLLSKATVNHTFYLASNLNYLITKKRLIMMTKTTKPSIALLKKLAVTPIIIALFFMLCLKTVAQEKITIEKPENNTYTKKKGAEKVSGPEKPHSLPKISKSPIAINKYEEEKTNELGKDSEATKITEITKQPEFPGGMAEFYKFVGKNFKFPKEAIDNNLEGKIFIKFMIEKDGNLTDFQILSDLGFGTREEIIRVLSLSPKWLPGEENNKPVRVQYSLPISLAAKS
ncbi:M56 family metallopeptidase [Flavobacterium sp.]|uniref:M56 family metallopeptidase n=1 Tax=Flavobacterium sp. TaxID=239 RepID=UPI002B4AD16A|nr:M56 family metallopeptidase [Flavobacterium sp.]HLF50680.1 M56 family metallopeptidase [Flavobacterium sp.]